MLILTRRIGETIVIELPSRERLQVAVLGAKGNQVRIGTEAPADILILREELVASEQLDRQRSSTISQQSKNNSSTI